jgi:dolichyl-phosphate beta-glucosyltransferase
MHGFNTLVKILCVQGIKDTQCGFKLFTREAAYILFSSLHIERWAFDIELLFIAKKLHFQISEVAVKWQEIDGSKLNVVDASLQMARDMVLIRALYMLQVWKIRAEGH